MQYLNIKNKISFAFFFLLISQTVFSQENSPYSRYGVGNLKSNEMLQNKGMGGVNTADQNPLYINPLNPASYSFLKMTALQAAIEGSLVTIKNSSTSNRVGASNLSYVNVAFPLAKNAGLSFGLLPITRSRYNFEKYSSYDGIDSNVYTTWFGGGGLQKIYIGGAYAYKNLSIGINTGYTFGNLTNTTETTFTDTLQILANNVSSRTVIGGFFWQGGLLYSHKLKDDYALNLGFTYSGSENLRAKKESYWESFIGTSTNTVNRVDSVLEKKGTIQLPSRYAAGLMLVNGDYWKVGIDYTASNWSQYRSYGSADSFGNAYMIKVGGAITPNTNATNDYWKRVNYRAGFYTGTDIVKLNQNKITQTGITVGAGFPIRRTNLSIGQINAVFDIGKRGTINSGLVKENYTRLALGYCSMTNGL
ncbi:MAG: hypothetical protein R2831_07845 [Chitinophagaceae bacterium]